MERKKPMQTAAFGVPEYEMRREGSYRPRISPEHLRQLWLLKQRVKKPITELVADALDYYFDDIQKGMIKYGDQDETADNHQQGER